MQLKIGDCITAAHWYAAYVVVGHNPITDRYTLKNEETGQEYSWALTAEPVGLRINGILYSEYKEGLTSGKTPIERKIAFMQKRWEKRHG